MKVSASVFFPHNDRDKISRRVAFKLKIHSSKRWRKCDSYFIHVPNHTFDPQFKRKYCPLMQMHLFLSAFCLLFFVFIHNTFTYLNKDKKPLLKKAFKQITKDSQSQNSQPKKEEKSQWS